MPWTVEDVDRFKQGLSEAGKRQWVEVANSLLESCLADGGSEETCAAKAIRQANGVVEEAQRESQNLGEAMLDAVFGEHATFKATVQGFLRAAHAVTKHPNIPSKVKKQIDALRTELASKKWADLVGGSETDGDPGSGNQAAAATEAKRTTSGAIGGANQGDEVSPILEEARSVFVEAEQGKVIRPDGTVRVRIIGPGQGSSAYYEAPQLARDAAVFKGSQVFWDHPSTREEHERPERSLRDLCAVASDKPPVYEEKGPAGPGLYTDVRVFKHFQPLVEEMAPHIGLSIRAAGTIKAKDVDGRRNVRVAEKFTSGSFDFVTKAGAGGKVVLNESERPDAIGQVVDRFLAAHPQESETSSEARTAFADWVFAEATREQEEEMEMKEAVAALEAEKAKNATLTAENTRLLTEALTHEADGIIASEVAKAALPEAARARLVQTLHGTAPLKEGKLDADALKTKILEAVKAEQTYVESLGLGKSKKITGMGGNGDSDAEGHKRLREAFVGRFMAEGKSQADAEKLADLACKK